jgi:hypothetical protein
MTNIYKYLLKNIEILKTEGEDELTVCCCSFRLEQEDFLYKYSMCIKLFQQQEKDGRIQRLYTLF